jgi:hypothetical protein
VFQDPAKWTSDYGALTGVFRAARDGTDRFVENGAGRRAFFFCCFQSLSISCRAISFLRVEMTKYFGASEYSALMHRIDGFRCGICIFHFS